MKRNYYITKWIYFSSLLIFLSYCALPIYMGYFKTTNFNVYNNIGNNDTAYYSNAMYLIDLIIDADDVLLNKNASPDHFLSPVDFYKSINVITLNPYNENYDMLDTISDIIMFNIYNKTEYVLSRGDTIIILYYPIINSLSEIFPSDEFDRLPYDSFNSIDEFFQSETGKQTYPFVLRLNSPPDTTRLFQVKIYVELLDGREFELYSEPVYIEP